MSKKWPRLCKVENAFLTAYFVFDAALIKKMALDRASDFLNHPELVNLTEKILTSKGEVALKLLTPEGLIGIRDDVWRSRRKQLSPHFIGSPQSCRVSPSGPKIAPMIEDIFISHASRLLDRLDQSSDGETINLHSYFTNLTMDIIGDAGFATEFGSQQNPDNIVSRSVRMWLDAGAKIGMYSVTAPDFG